MSVNKESQEEKKVVVVKNATDLQRIKLEKLMKNPDRPVLIPEQPKQKSLPSVPDFVRNVMGSSAGAGSGEFHVYRHLRRKEYARQKFIQEKSEKEKLDDEYHEKIEQNRRIAEQKTAKRRAKRLKKKQKAKTKPKKSKTDVQKDESSSSSESDSEEECKSQGQAEESDIDKSDGDEKNDKQAIPNEKAISDERAIDEDKATDDVKAVDNEKTGIYLVIDK